nr:uncharacterized protein LOC104090715 [Nicotiana tomentosiformis]
MVDDGSDACIIHVRVLAQMKLEDRIVPRCITLMGFNNAVEWMSGEIMLPVLAGGVTLETTFHFMDQDMAYNAIIGRPWIHAMKAVPSSLYQVIKFPTPWGVFRKDVIRDPKIIEATGSTVEDLDPIQLDKDDHSKKVYIGHKLQEPDMPGIPKEIATHKLNVSPFYLPVRQVRQKFNSIINNAFHEEVEKLLENGSIRESKYPQWFANVVMVKKKNEKWRMGYILEVGDKNVQRPPQQNHESLHRRHVGQIKKERRSHRPLERSFQHTQTIWYEIDPEKCSCDVTWGYFLGFLVSQRGIEVNPD